MVAFRKAGWCTEMERESWRAADDYCFLFFALGVPPLPGLVVPLVEYLVIVWQKLVQLVQWMDWGIPSLWYPPYKTHKSFQKDIVGAQRTVQLAGSLVEDCWLLVCMTGPSEDAVLLLQLPSALEFNYPGKGCRKIKVVILPADGTSRKEILPSLSQE